MGRSIITFDSPWEEIYDAARSAPWGETCDRRPSSLQRPPLSDGEFNRLAGIPVLVLHDNQLPLHPANDGLIVRDSYEYDYAVSLRASEVHHLIQQEREPLASLKHAALAAAQQREPWIFTSCMRPGDAGAPQIRTTQAGAAPDFKSPLPHRLSGQLAVAAAIVLTDCEHITQPFVIGCAERRLWLPGQEHKVMSDGRTLMHLVQLRPAQWSLETQVLAGRDAENGALSLYQTGFSGPSSHAAASIMSHMSGLFQLAPKHGFWPGQAALDYASANAPITALRLFALYHQTGQKPPEWKALEGAACARAWGWSPSMAALAFGKEFGEIRDFATRYIEEKGVTTMLQDTLKGLCDLARREFEALPEHTRPLARQLADAATFTNPGLMGFDPVKPRVSLQIRKHPAPA